MQITILFTFVHVLVADGQSLFFISVPVQATVTIVSGLCRRVVGGHFRIRCSKWLRQNNREKSVISE